MKMLKKKNKKAWVKILEVFVSIMIMSAAIVLFLNQNSFYKDNTEGEFNEKMEYVLRTIQRDNQLRGEILDASLPVEWEDFEGSGLTNTRTEIITKMPGNFNCSAKVCYLEDDCLNLNTPSDKNTYSITGYISADLDTYSPRQLKLFCWRK
jgi:hypothetical protein